MYEWKQFHVVKNTTDPATNEVFVHFGSIKQRINQICPDNIHQRDRYQVRHHDYIHDGANGILGSPQQVAFSGEYFEEGKNILAVLLLTGPNCTVLLNILHEMKFQVLLVHRRWQQTHAYRAA